MGIPELRTTIKVNEISVTSIIIQLFLSTDTLTATKCMTEKTKRFIGFWRNVIKMVASRVKVISPNHDVSDIAVEVVNQ